MADKTTTLKTKTNDNVYPNVIGDNRKNAFVDSSTITHHFYDKTHKVGFQIANETNIKIQNSLQKPAGLTKTKLVGVGTNGQENIEIGDNLTLANGKLSATGGGSNVNILVGSESEAIDNGYQGTYSGIPDKSKINILHTPDFGDYVITFLKDDVYTGYVEVGGVKIIIMLSGGQYTLMFESSGTSSGTSINTITIGDNSDTFSGTINSEDLTVFYYRIPGQDSYMVLPISSLGNYGTCISVNDDNGDMTVFSFLELTKAYTSKKYHLKYHSHFITLTSSNSTFYLTYQNTSDEKIITLVSLKTALTGKCLLCTGHTDTEKAEYISGEGENIVVGVVDNSDNSTSGITIDSSFTITDLVSPVK